jgi:hypothetical protein
MDLPYAIVRVPGAHALEELRSLAAQGRGYPVLIGAPDELEQLSENYGYAEDSVEDLLEEAEQLEPLEWLRERAEGEPEFYEDESVHGPWPADVGPSDDFTGHIDLTTHQPHAEVCIALLPLEEAWQAPCLVKYGGWNECPLASEHAALFRLWQAQYGATPLVISGSTIEMAVARPPSTREDALALARQQYIYCPDIVEQGTETIEALAATLLNGHSWFFWWD